MTDEAISVVVPTYEKGELLAEVLEALDVQRRGADEVIVVEDGGGGGDREIASKYRTRYIALEDRGYRLCTARNVGIKLARNENVVVLDGDCKPLDGCLETYREQIEAGVLVSGGIRWQMPEGGDHGDTRFDENGKPGEQLGWMNVYGGNLGFRREDAFRVGLFNEEFNGNWGQDDFEFGWKFKHLGMELRFCGDALVLHQYHHRPDQSGKKTNIEKFREEQKKIRKNGIEPVRESKGVIGLVCPDVAGVSHSENLEIVEEIAPFEVNPFAVTEEGLYLVRVWGKKTLRESVSLDYLALYAMGGKVTEGHRPGALAQCFALMESSGDDVGMCVQDGGLAPGEVERIEGGQMDEEQAPPAVGCSLVKSEVAAYMEWEESDATDMGKNFTYRVNDVGWDVLKVG